VSVLYIHIICGNRPLVEHAGMAVHADMAVHAGMPVRADIRMHAGVSAWTCMLMYGPAWTMLHAGVWISTAVGPM
jgi:hypothetical protein